jgi:hypothetical protein
MKYGRKIGFFIDCEFRNQSKADEELEKLDGILRIAQSRFLI